MNEKNENDDLKNKDEPTACKHSASQKKIEDVEEMVRNVETRNK